MLKFCRSDDEDVEDTCPVSRKPRSLIAMLAEGRKANKSIHSFGPAAISAPMKASKPNVSATGNADLLSDILASQTQLRSFGKEREPSSMKSVSAASSSSRVLSAILASKDTLSRLDREIPQSKVTVMSCTWEKVVKDRANGLASIKKFQIPKLPKTCSVKNSDSTTQSSASTQQNAAATSEQQQHEGAKKTSQQSPVEGNGRRGAASGDADDPDDPDDWNKRPSTSNEPEDKEEEKEENEEDVDLYSDIESMEEESPSVDNCTKLVQVDQVNSINNNVIKKKKIKLSKNK